MKNRNNEIPEEKDISLRNIYEIINALKVDIQDKHEILEERMLSLKKCLTDKFSKLAYDVKKQVKDEIQKEKEKMEEDINTNFQFLENDLRSKMEVFHKSQQAHNNLEQYTRKNSIRLFGFKENDEETSPEHLAIDFFKEKLQVDVREDEIEIIHRAGKYRPEGRHNPKKARPILIKFLSHKTKARVMRAKKALKGSEFWLAEDLTSETAEKVKLLNEIRKVKKIKNVWTIDGKIRVHELDDTVIMNNTSSTVGQSVIIIPNKIIFKNDLPNLLKRK